MFPGGLLVVSGWPPACTWWSLSWSLAGRGGRGRPGGAGGAGGAGGLGVRGRLGRLGVLVVVVVVVVVLKLVIVVGVLCHCLGICGGPYVVILEDIL